MDFTENVGFLLHKLMFIMDKRADENLQACCDLSYSQFLILMMIVKCQLPTQKIVSNNLNLTEAAVSKQIETLHQKGFVQRTINSHNRRENILQLTNLGQEKFQKSWSVLENMGKDVFEKLTAQEQESFRTILTKLVDIVSNQSK
jgi:DNA-binding MarR family transcriptional regulator